MQGFLNNKLNATHSVINLEAIQWSPYWWFVADVISEEEADLSCSSIRGWCAFVCCLELADKLLEKEMN